MSRCSNPLYALDLGLKEDGKRNIKILPRRADLYSYEKLSERYGKGNILALPCGKCLACKLNHAKEWAVRCCLEASLYEDNWFITLTYDDEHLPSDYSLHRKHLTDFIKRLRYYSPGLRYFGCGEYGSNTSRPHYHLLVFNLGIKDLKCISKGSIGGYYYESKLIESVWGFGNIVIGDVSYSSASYVARYAMKKIYGSQESDEFLCMSTKPGLGYGYLQAHPEMFDFDSIYGNFGTSKVSKIPRYFEKIFERSDLFGQLALIKDRRISKMDPVNLHQLNSKGLDSYEKMYQYDGEILEARFKDIKRRKDL